MLTCFGMIWNMTKFQNETQNLTKFVHFQNLIVKEKWHIGATINTIYKNFQNISFENSSIGKHVSLGKKNSKKDNSIKCKVNTLICYMLFGPTCHFSFSLFVIHCHVEYFQVFLPQERPIKTNFTLWKTRFILMFLLWFS
jgi:hypothetical protein